MFDARRQFPEIGHMTRPIEVGNTRSVVLDGPSGLRVAVAALARTDINPEFLIGTYMPDGSFVSIIIRVLIGEQSERFDSIQVRVGEATRVGRCNRLRAALLLAAEDNYSLTDFMRSCPLLGNRYGIWSMLPEGQCTNVTSDEDCEKRQAECWAEYYIRMAQEELAEP